MIQLASGNPDRVIPGHDSANSKNIPHRPHRQNQITPEIFSALMQPNPSCKKLPFLAFSFLSFSFHP
jgi:hypothetical protein